MSASMPPAPPPPPMPSRVGGAIQGMPAGQPDPKAQMAAKFQSVLGGVKEIIQVLTAAPGVDKAKLQQGVQMLQQGMQAIAGALPQGGGASPGGMPGAGGAPPGAASAGGGPPAPGGPPPG